MNLAREIATLRREVSTLAAAGDSFTVGAVELARLAGFTLDLWQRAVLLSESRQIILLVTRQGGKSTVSSIRALHKALGTPASGVCEDFVGKAPGAAIPAGAAPPPSRQLPPA